MPGDKRATIISKAEEKAFFTESNEYEEAQLMLLNPEKRLGAELDWFFGISIEKMADICNYIAQSKEIALDDLTSISRLNALLHNFTLFNYDDYFELGYAILELDELYDNIDILQLLTTINTNRQQSGLREVLIDELEREFNKKRHQIRQLVSHKTVKLSEKDYIDFITIIAEKYIADEDYNDGIILSDIVDQYEINTQNLIEEASNEIHSHIERIKEISTNEAIEENISGLIRRVEKWDRLVQPLQLKSMASGVVHGESQNMGQEIHEFSVWLHNEKGLSDISLNLINAMKPIFAEIGELYAIFESDSNSLSSIIKSNKEAEQIVAEIESLKISADSLKVFATSIKVDEFINTVKIVNRKVKQIPLDDESLEKIRENICYMVRELAITLHNDKHQTDYALRISKMLVAEFSDIHSVKTKLIQDVSTLSQQSMLQNRIRYQQQPQVQAQKSQGIGCLIIIGIIVLVCLISGVLSQCSNDNNPEPYIFSQSAKTGDDVYIDIVSIEPVYSISTGGSYHASGVVCRCKTSDGKTAWVYMSVYEYNNYIDSNAEINNYLNSDYDTVQFSPAKRISGKARTAEVLCDGLSAKTGTMILEFESIE